MDDLPLQSAVELNAVVTVDAERALRQADELDAEREAARIRGLLHGVPMAVKDAFAMAGIRAATGSRGRADHVPGEDAVDVARLVDAGAVILRKTNMPEGVTGQETANAFFGRTGAASRRRSRPPLALAGGYRYPPDLRRTAAGNV